MAKKGKSCKAAPIVEGELSKLYTDLYEGLKSLYGLAPEVARLLTNVLYVRYTADSQILLALDAAGKRRHPKQNEHLAPDVFSILNGTELVKFAEVNALNTLSIDCGIKVDAIHSVEFDSWKEAYSKAQDINLAYPTLSAFVLNKNGSYIVKVANMNPLNIVDRANTEMLATLMYIVESQLNNVGLLLDNLDFVQGEMFGSKVQNLISWIVNTSRTDPKYLMEKDLQMLLSLHLGQPIVDRLINKYGSIEEAAKTIYDWYRNNYTPTDMESVLLQSGMNLMISFNGLDIDSLDAQTTEAKKLIEENNADYKALSLYDSLNEKFRIGELAIEVNKKSLTSLSRILAYAIQKLGHQAKMIEDAGDKEESLRLKLIVQNLNKDLETKEYSLSLVEFLSEQTTQLERILKDLITVIPLGADMAFLEERGNVLREASQYLAVYGPIIDRISTLLGVDVDINMSDADVQRLLLEAMNLHKTILDITTAANDSMEAWAKQCISLMLGTNSEITINEALENISKDATIFDKMYNGTRVSHIPTAILVNYIQMARRTRVAKLADLSGRIARASSTKDSKDARRGKLVDTSFMYENIDGTWYIKSPYDFKGHEERRRRYAARLRRNKVTGVDYDIAMYNWELANTHEIPVDGERTERVPNALKEHNPLDDFTKDLMQVYKELLKLKGEIDSMHPSYARSLYTPPQVRKSSVDYVGEGKVGKATKEWKERTFDVREDEYGLGQIKETDGGGVISVKTDLEGNTGLVPVNYILTLKNQDELLLNMSEGLLHLAASAVNYEAMSLIADTVEMLGDWIIGKVSSTTEGYNMAQSFTYGSKLFYEILNNKANSRVLDIISDQKARMVYNDHTYQMDVSGAKRWAFIRRLTSILALSFNLFGGINNGIEGVRKNFERGLIGGSDAYNLKDLSVAWADIFGGHVFKARTHLLDFFSGLKTSLNSLIMQRFDPKKEKFHELKEKKYRTSKYKTHLFRVAASRDYSIILYSIGETLNNMPLVYSRLNHIKVLINGKKRSLKKAFMKERTEDGSYRLAIKPGATLLNGDPITEEYLDEVAREINALSEENHGGMSDEAMGAMALNVLALWAAQLRRWMIEVLSTYFRGHYFNPATGKRMTGAWAGIYDVSIGTVIDAINKHAPWSKDFIDDLLTFIQDVIMNYKNLRRDLKLGALRWITATGLMTVTSVLVDAMLKAFYKDYKDEEWFKTLFFILKKQQMDLSVAVPDLNHITRVGDVGRNIVEIMDKPFAAYSTIDAASYIVVGLRDIGEPVQRGPHKGEDKYMWGMIDRWLKPVGLYDRLKGLEDTNELLESLGGAAGRGKYSINKEYERLTGEKAENKKQESVLHHKSRRRRRRSNQESND